MTSYIFILNYLYCENKRLALGIPPWIGRAGGSGRLLLNRT
jgi:hypothetical protein